MCILNFVNLFSLKAVTVFIHRPWVKINIKGYGCIRSVNVCKIILKLQLYFYLSKELLLMIKIGFS